MQHLPSIIQSTTYNYNIMVNLCNVSYFVTPNYTSLLNSLCKQMVTYT